MINNLKIMIKKGDKGANVVEIQQLLNIKADGDFGNITENAVKDFQRKNNLTVDGVVGNITLSKLREQKTITEQPNNLPNNFVYPEPKFKPLTQNQLKELFGTFPYTINANGSTITVTNNWRQNNMVTIEIPQIANLLPYRTNKMTVHKKVAEQFKTLFNEWEKAGLIHLVKTYDGAYNARLIRGSKTALSSHAYGIAFDINTKWNGLGVNPPLPGEEGTLVELVNIASDCGFYWGGFFSRKDGMHFEIGKIL
jgi:hypothetical protein